LKRLEFCEATESRKARVKIAYRFFGAEREEKSLRALYERLADRSAGLHILRSNDDGILHAIREESEMATPSSPRRRSLEREIIIAVVVLYLMITGVMVTVHYMQPTGQETTTSSSSPSHGERSARPPSSK
jgi:hypothetical protein